MPTEHAVFLERQSLKGRCYGVLPQGKVMSDWPIAKDAFREKMIPLHFVVVGVNIVNPVVTYALRNVRNIQVPVGVDHNALEDF